MARLVVDPSGLVLCPRRGPIEVDWCLGCPRRTGIERVGDKRVIECDPGLSLGEYPWADSGSPLRDVPDIWRTA
jgi:hypothetical protein